MPTGLLMKHEGAARIQIAGIVNYQTLSNATVAIEQTLVLILGRADAQPHTRTTGLTEENMTGLAPLTDEQSQRLEAHGVPLVAIAMSPILVATGDVIDNGTTVARPAMTDHIDLDHTIAAHLVAALLLSVPGVAESLHQDIVALARGQDPHRGTTLVHETVGGMTEAVGLSALDSLAPPLPQVAPLHQRRGDIPDYEAGHNLGGDDAHRLCQVRAADRDLEVKRGGRQG